MFYDRIIFVRTMIAFVTPSCLRHTDRVPRCLEQPIPSKHTGRAIYEGFCTFEPETFPAEGSRQPTQRILALVYFF